MNAGIGLYTRALPSYEINPNHSVMTEEEEGNCWQVWQDRQGFDLVVFRIHSIIKLSLSIDDDNEGLGDDDDLAPLEEVEDAADEASKIEEVDQKACCLAVAFLDHV